jgi:hypothetical protein
VVFQVADKAVDDFADFPAEAVDTFKIVWTKVVLIEGNIQAILHLGTGAPGIGKKPDKIVDRLCVEAFADIVHDRDGGSRYLAGQPEIS